MSTSTTAALRERLETLEADLHDDSSYEWPDLARDLLALVDENGRQNASLERERNELRADLQARTEERDEARREHPFVDAQRAGTEQGNYPHEQGRQRSTRGPRPAAREGVGVMDDGKEPPMADDRSRGAQVAEEMRERCAKVAERGEYDWCETPDGANDKPCANGTQIAAEIRALPVASEEDKT